MKSSRALTTPFVPIEAPGGRRIRAALRATVASAAALVATRIERRRARLERLNDYWLRDIGIERLPPTVERLRIDRRLPLWP